MRFGLDVCTLGDYAEPSRVVELARAAETAGWEALFVWDHLAFAWGVPAADPWVTLAAVATATTRLRLGTAVTPVARRRPAVLAQQVATLDRLSNGRVVLGAGLGGVPVEFTAFGEPGDDRVHAARVDEALPLLAALLAGKTVAHRGECYTVDGVTLAPLPVQSRVPVWVGGMSRPALRRAARWDGWLGNGDDERGVMTTSPEQVAEHVAYLRRHRTRTDPFDIALIGQSTPDDGEMLRRYEDAGVTWWLEHVHALRGSAEELLARVLAGPVRA